MKKRLIAVIILCLAVLLSSCSTDNPQNKLSKTELEELRTEFPYNDVDNTLEDRIVLEHFQDLSKYQNNSLNRPAIDAVIIVTLTGEMFSEKAKEVLPFRENTSDSPPAPTTLVGNYCFAIVEDILWGGIESEVGEEVVIGLGSSLRAEGLDYKHCFIPGQRYVMLVNQSENDSIGVFYPTSKYASYYLTDDDILLSITSEPGFDECSGLTVLAFKNLCGEVLKVK